ncbi:MAG: DUF1707 domain-containing protein [Streptosporangiales bacterium]|nr:DUF1707 domain-containing protein [Streptosporangiales bacterium]
MAEVGEGGETGLERQRDPGSEVRASDAEREQVVELMRQASAEGRLTLEELVERSDAAYTAKTRGELERLTRDLPAPVPGKAPVPATTSSTVPARRPSRWAVAVMAGVDRRGRWRPAERMNVVAVMGGATIDLREAEVTDPEVTINAVAVMGGIDVVVPEGVRVEFTGFAFMGGRDEHVADVPVRPGTPLIRVRGFALMGGVDVKSRPVRARSPRDDPGDRA